MMVSDKLAGLTRREFTKGAGAVAALVSGGTMPTGLSTGIVAGTGVAAVGCAITFAKKPIEDSDFFKGPILGILPNGDYPEHTYDKYTGPKGTDFTGGFGTLLVAPTIADVWDSDVIQAGTTMKFVSPFGDIIEISCQSAVFQKINDPTSPSKLTGREGYDCGRGVIGSLENADKPHAHMHVLVPPFEPEYNKLREYKPYVRENGIEHFLVNPNEKRASGRHIRESIPTGDISPIERLVAQQHRMINEIAERNPDSDLAKLIRLSREDPMFKDYLLSIIAWTMRRDGLLGSPRLMEDVDGLLHWKSHLTGYLHAPYAPSKLQHEYRRMQPDLFEKAPGLDPRVYKQRAKAAWENIRWKHEVNLRQGNYGIKEYTELKQDLEAFRAMTPTYMAVSFYRNYGIALARLAQRENMNKSGLWNALLYFLGADAFFKFKYEPQDPNLLLKEIYSGNRAIAWTARELGMPGLHGKYLAKVNDSRFDGVRQ